MTRLPEDVQHFLEEIIRHYILGSRGPEFAEWVVTEATFMLEFRGLFPPFS